MSYVLAVLVLAAEIRVGYYWQWPGATHTLPCWCQQHWQRARSRRFSSFSTASLCNGFFWVGAWASCEKHIDFVGGATHSNSGKNCSATSLRMGLIIKSIDKQSTDITVSDGICSAVIDGRFATSFCRTMHPQHIFVTLTVMILTFWWHYCSYQTSWDTQTRPAANRATWQVMCKHISGAHQRFLNLRYYGTATLPAAGAQASFVSLPVRQQRRHCQVICVRHHLQMQQSRGQPHTSHSLPCQSLS
jgi:hypothetical protein